MVTGTARRARHRLVWRAATFILMLCVAAALFGGVTHAQVVPPVGGGTTTPPQLPEDLAPEDVDALLARLTDSDIRSLLRDELARRAEEQAAQAASPFGLTAALDRLEEMRATIAQRGERWWRAFGSIDERLPEVQRRMETASRGVWGMIGAYLLIIIGGVAAAALTHRLTLGAIARLKDTSGESYLDRLIRTVALTVVEVLPIVAFWSAGRVLAPMFADALGPLQTERFSHVWIFSVGVTQGWLAIVLSRRAFAPWTPQLRIAAVSDHAAEEVHKLIRRAVFLAIGGWTIAGLFPALGFGFPPAMVLVALTGTAVFAAMIFTVARNFTALRASWERDLAGVGQSLGLRVRRLIYPWVLIALLVISYVYWLGLWLETGRNFLDGPLNTALVLLLLPMLDRLGDELISSWLPPTERAQRFHRVLLSGWRTLIAIVLTIVVAALWGLNLFEIAKGEDAPAWASATFDVALTLLIGRFVWRLVRVALHTEKRVSSGDQEGDAPDEAASSRLDTLVPMFRNLILITLAVVIAMIILSAIGVDIGPLLASAGIIGIAIGFGAQTLVRDIFSGAFFLIDDAFRVGEYIELEGDVRGEVEAISIRSLQLRHHRGAVVTIPFGEMKNVTNYNRDWVIYKLSFRMEPDTDPTVVKRIVKRIGAELMEDPEHGPKFLEPLKSQGVLSIDEDSALIMRVKFKAKPRTQFVLRREVYHRLRAAFAEAGVRFARRKVEVVGSDPAAAAAAAAEATQTQQPGGGLAAASQSQ